METDWISLRKMEICKHYDGRKYDKNTADCYVRLGTGKNVEI
jgi:hypothetical protein